MTEIDRLLQSLADPYRRGFVERLALGPASASELAGPLDVGLPAVLKHLKVLEAGGIVVSRKAGRVRTYRLRENALAPLSGWVEARQADLHAAFDRLADLMADIPEEKDH